MRKRQPGCRAAESVAGFGVERGERRMAEAVAANEVNDEEDKQSAANHDSDGDLKRELQVEKIRDLADHLRAKASYQLRGKHVNADGSGVRSAGHHVMKNGGD